MSTLFLRFLTFQQFEQKRRIYLVKPNKGGAIERMLYKMIEYDFSNTYLSKEDIKIIKSAKKGIKNNEDLFRYRQNGLIDFKEYKTDNIGQLVPVDDMLYQTEKAKAYFEYVKRTKAKTWLPFLVSSLLSIIAIIISIVKC